MSLRKETNRSTSSTLLLLRVVVYCVCGANRGIVFVAEECRKASTRIPGKEPNYFHLGIIISVVARLIAQSCDGNFASSLCSTCRGTQIINIPEDGDWMDGVEDRMVEAELGLNEEDRSDGWR